MGAFYIILFIIAGIVLLLSIPVGINLVLEALKSRKSKRTESMPAIKAERMLCSKC